MWDGRCGHDVHSNYMILYNYIYSFAVKLPRHEVTVGRCAQDSLQTIHFSPGKGIIANFASPLS